MSCTSRVTTCWRSCGLSSAMSACSVSRNACSCRARALLSRLATRAMSIDRTMTGCSRATMSAMDSPLSATRRRGAGAPAGGDAAGVAPWSGCVRRPKERAGTGTAPLRPRPGWPDTRHRAHPGRGHPAGRPGGRGASGAASAAGGGESFGQVAPIGELGQQVLERKLDIGFAFCTGGAEGVPDPGAPEPRACGCARRRPRSRNPARPMPGRTAGHQYGWARSPAPAGRSPGGRRCGRAPRDRRVPSGTACRAPPRAARRCGRRGASGSGGFQR